MFAFVVHKEEGTGNMEEWKMKEGQEEIVEAYYKLCNIGGDFSHLSKDHSWCDHWKKKLDTLGIFDHKASIIQ